MVENFLVEIYRKLRSKQVAIIIDGENLDSTILTKLSTLREKINELGEIRVAEVIFENKIAKRDFEYLRESGFTDMVVPGNIELSYLLETYDLVLEEKVDFLVLGTHREELIPLFTECRKTVTVFGLIDNFDSVSKAFIESFDGIIEVDKIDEFVFNATQFSEFDQLIQQASSDTNGSSLMDHSSNISDYTGSVESVVDETNIGTFSEDIIEDEHLIEEMKKEEKENKAKK